MIQPEGHHLAEFNIGVLKYDWDDPRVADFTNNLSRVNAIAQRSPGFVWTLPADEMEAAQMDAGGPLGGNPRTASTLSVWEDAASLRKFVFNTVHRHFYDRRNEWYDMGDVLRLVMWWVPVGHIPSVAEAAARLRHMEQEGASAEGFGWAHLETA